MFFGFKMSWFVRINILTSAVTIKFFKKFRSISFTIYFSCFFDFSFINSYSQTAANTYTSTGYLIYAVNNLIANKVTVRQYYDANITAPLSVAPSGFSTQTIGLTANSTINIPLTQVLAGDRYSIVFVQQGIGSYTVGFTGAIIAGGSFVPAAAVGAKSSISFEFDGTVWQERSRAIGLA